MTVDKWPQRKKLKQLFKDYKKEHGLSKEEGDKAMSTLLGVTEDSLNSLLYDKRLRPSLPTIQKMSRVFHVSVSELMDDPGGEPLPGVDAEQWANVDEVDRLMARAVFADVTGDELTRAQKDALYKAYMDMKKTIMGLGKK